MIPTYNAERVVSSVIKSLLEQNYPKNHYEIIIVDDGSTDRTVEVASKFPIRVIKNKHHGPAFQRNFGAKKAKGGILLFTDSDCIPEKDWIKNMVKPFENPGVVGVSGTYKTLNKKSFMARFSGYEIKKSHLGMQKQESIDFIGTFSAGYRKNIFMKFGGFSTKFKTSSGEDPELSYRIAKSGLKMVFQQTAVVAHPHPATLWKYLKQKYQRAFWRNWMYWSGHADKLVSGDSYTSKLLFPQIFLSSIVALFFPSLFLFGFNPISIIGMIIVSFISIAFLLNLDFLIFLWKIEKKQAFLAPIIYALRNLFCIIAIVHGMVKYIFRR